MINVLVTMCCIIGYRMTTILVSFLLLQSTTIDHLSPLPVLQMMVYSKEVHVTAEALAFSLCVLVGVGLVEMRNDP